MESNKDFVSECLQYERAFCSAKCPFNLDVRDFIGKIQQGRFNVAYRTYQNTVGFPGIVSVLCNEPCKQVCPMKDAGGSISIRTLEVSTINYARNTEPDQYNMPAKNNKIAIIGAGISGLACALRLTTRKYNVTVFEKSDRIGGHLNDLPERETFLADIEKQFANEKYSLFLNSDISSLDHLGYDAIYIATGKEGNDFGLSLSEDGSFASIKPGVFIGGSINGVDSMNAISQGLSVSGAIERYLKIGKMNQPDKIAGTKLIREAIRIIPGDAVQPENGNTYTKDEALTESKRCLKCACDACVHYSPLMNYFKKFPKRIADEVEITIIPSSLDGHARLATRFISTCNHCGLCKEVCPVNIDVGEFLLQSHRTMHEIGAMPWAFHEFYLRDMEFSNSEAALTKLPQGYNKSKYVFFPGCQLGASDPRYVTQSYKFLTEHFPDTALMLGCCGAPAEWAGNDGIHKEAIAKIKSDWIELGKPVAIFACPMCKQMFRQHLPEIKGEFLYTIIAEEGITTLKYFNDETASVFDPCASRYEPEVQRIIRELATKAGFHLKPLPMEGKRAECCSYGGQVAITHPPYAKHVVKTKIEQSNNPYITYCSNCLDIFANAGKQTWHILDILFGLENKNRKQPTVSERRDNRLLLKHQLLEECWKETNIMEKPEKELFISQELKEKLNKELILESDIFAVIEHCEQSGKKLFDPDAKTFTGHMQIGNMTYWVEYMVKENSAFELINAYSHRMKIEED